MFHAGVAPWVIAESTNSRSRSDSDMARATRP